jgi:hypothetical protein
MLTSTQCSDDELVRLLADENEWYARHALRLLHERAGRGLSTIALDELKQLTDTSR